MSEIEKLTQKIMIEKALVFIEELKLSEDLNKKEIQTSKIRIPRCRTPRYVGSEIYPIRRYSAPSKTEAADFSIEF